MWDDVCCGFGLGFRMYPTAEEKVEMLKKYKEMLVGCKSQLDNEIKGVEERLKEMEKKK